jgi:glycosyl transferase family 92
MNSGDRRSNSYLSICACLGYDAPYLLEWIEFHRLVGAERFFLYNNGDREAQRQLLRPYTDEGIVVLHEWPEFPPVFSAYEDCLTRHRTDSRWIAFIDTDEFLFSPLGRPVPELLVDYEEWPAVVVNWAMFGTSGHRTKPPGPVIENFVWRTDDSDFNTHVKSIVDPARTEAYCNNPHFFFYTEGTAVNENCVSVDGAKSEYVSFERLRLNHYWTRSEEEALAKFGRSRADDATVREPPDFAELDRTLNQQQDEAIKTYVAGLRDALNTRRAVERASS